PWRLSTSIERLAEADYYTPGAYWYLDEDGLHTDHIIRVGHNSSLFRRSVADLVDGYPHTSMGVDRIFEQRLRGHPAVKEANPPALRLDEWFYIYRWGVSLVHLSSRATPNAWYEYIGKLPVEEGRSRLWPHWKEEYVTTTRNALGISPYQV
ncbi:MAG TPA: hypothetical protein VKR06_12335, partial [Ktedonosporobacter sp.]|nr:hypothetical protein [Ktedonosporobacter sp.]